jgi:hypothetical protein
VGGLALLVYILTLAPTVFLLDSAELTLAAATLGLVHSPGYPLHLVLGHFVTYLPVGDLGYRLNLLSALAGAGTASALAALVTRLTRGYLPALVAGLSYAFCFYAWALSVVAEVYTLQALFLAGLLLILWQWRTSGGRGWLLSGAVLAGLAAGNSANTVLWWPGLALLGWTSPHHRHLSPADYGRALAALTLGLAPVLYLPLCSASQPEFAQVGHFDAAGQFHPLDLTQPRNLIWYLSGGQFSQWVFRYTPAQYAQEALRFLHWLWAAFLGAGLPLGAVGIWRLWRRERAAAAGLFLTALLPALFFIGYRIMDKDTMFLPVYLVWAVFLGLGVGWLLEHVPQWARPLALVLPAALFWVNLSYADVSDFSYPLEQAHERLLAAEPNALYLSTWGEAELMRYHQMVNGLRPDVKVVNLFFITSENLEALVESRLEGDGHVYSTYSAPALPRRFRLEEDGEVYRVILRSD